MSSPSNPVRPVNLTLLADRLAVPRDGEQSRTAGVLNRADLAFDIQTADGAGRLEAEPGERDEIYVILAGYGAFRCADGELVEFTAGDVLFVPAGTAPRFEGLSPRFRTWRISLGGGGG